MHHFNSQLPIWCLLNRSVRVTNMGALSLNLGENYVVGDFFRSLIFLLIILKLINSHHQANLYHCFCIYYKRKVCTYSCSPLLNIISLTRVPNWLEKISQSIGVKKLTIFLKGDRLAKFLSDLGTFWFRVRIFSMFC